MKRLLWLLPLALAACGLPSPDQARRDLAPSPPLTPEYRDVPLLRLEVKAGELFPLLFGENPNAELLTLDSQSAIGNMLPGDLALRIGVPEFTLEFQVPLTALNTEVSVPFNLPQIPGVGAKIQALLDQTQLPEAYLFQSIVLESPSQYALAGRIRTCDRNGNNCSQVFKDTSNQEDNLRFINGQPKPLKGEASTLFNALKALPFQGDTPLTLKLIPRGGLTDYAGQGGCTLTGCTVRQRVTDISVLAPFGAVAPNPFTVESEPLPSPISNLPASWIDDLKRYTVATTLTLEIQSSLPTQTQGLTLWIGPGTIPRFDDPGPDDFVYAGTDPVPAAPVDGQGRSTGMSQTTIRTELSGENLKRFLNVLTQPNVHAAVRLTLIGPEATGGLFRYKASDFLKIYAKGTARLQIGGN
ncbi:hypothetical protein FJNA_21090 [Thermus sp. FJN-A]